MTDNERALVEKLRDQTRAGKLTWESLGEDSGLLMAVLPNRQSFHIELQPPEDVLFVGPPVERRVRLRMLDQKGSTVLDTGAQEAQGPREDYDLLLELYEAARDRARSTDDETIKRALKALEKL
jgi:hypothetical protein